MSDPAVAAELKSKEEARRRGASAKTPLAAAFPAGSVDDTVTAPTEEFPYFSASASYEPATYVDGSSALTPALTVPDTGFACAIRDLSVRTTTSKCQSVSTDGVCTPGRFDRQQEAGLVLISPAGTRVTLVTATSPAAAGGPGGTGTNVFTMSAPAPAFNDDNLALTAGTGERYTPASGSNLNALRGQSALGDWRMEYSDNEVDDPFAVNSWEIVVACDSPNQEPTCDSGNFIAPAEFWWGPPINPAAAPIGGWMDRCAKVFDACQGPQPDPATLNFNCGCAMWACLYPTWSGAASMPPACGAYTEDLRTTYCASIMTAWGNGATCPSGPALPATIDECALL